MLCENNKHICKTFPYGKLNHIRPNSSITSGPQCSTYYHIALSSAQLKNFIDYTCSSEVLSSYITECVVDSNPTLEVFVKKIMLQINIVT